MCPVARGTTHRVVLAVLTEDLWGDPPLGARHPGPPAEAVSAHRQLLTQAKVGDHGPRPTVGVGHGHQDVVGLQVSVHWGREEWRRSDQTGRITCNLGDLRCLLYLVQLQ